MNVRTLATTAALAAAGSVTIGLAGTAPALAGADVARDRGVFAYTGFPEQGSARVHSVSTAAGRTMVTLTVKGMTGGHTYGAHAHVLPCDVTDKMAAGPHWQLEEDPVSPSVDPGYANPHNEIWLDVTTNEAGNGTAKATLDFAFAGTHRPRSVIIHAMPTATAPGSAGTAGARLACLDVDF